MISRNFTFFPVFPFFPDFSIFSATAFLAIRFLFPPVLSSVSSFCFLCFVVFCCDFVRFWIYGVANKNNKADAKLNAKQAGYKFNKWK